METTAHASSADRKRSDSDMGILKSTIVTQIKVSPFTLPKRLRKGPNCPLCRTLYTIKISSSAEQLTEERISAEWIDRRVPLFKSHWTGADTLGTTRCSEIVSSREQEQLEDLPQELVDNLVLDMSRRYYATTAVRGCHIPS
ncbi:hypothetical protein TNCV_2496281 [Trichonephila clavipes]|nr:hypothetical protein TNCV_2496281 [Trichonephila clavipes]